MKLFSLVAVVLLAWCVADADARCRDPQPRDAKVQQACEGRGGKYLEDCCAYRCIEVANDAGRRCSADGECEGACLGSMHQHGVQVDCSKEGADCRCSRWLDKETPWMSRGAWDYEVTFIDPC